MQQCLFAPSRCISSRLAFTPAHAGRGCAPLETVGLRIDDIDSGPNRRAVKIATSCCRRSCLAFCAPLQLGNQALTITVDVTRELDLQQKRRETLDHHVREAAVG